jgi:FMN reductase (NADPH)/FMN reductase [NAD(P)H]
MISNPVLEVLNKRKSVRVFTSQLLSAEEKSAILQAAMRAPTAGNMMLYSIIEVEDQALKDRLAVTCDDQPFIASSPYVLLFVADYQRWFDYYLTGGVKELCAERGLPFRCPQEGDFLLAACDTLIAAQTAVIAAESLGIGSCYIGDILGHFEEHRKLFHLPQYAMPVTLICFGYPTEQQANRAQPERFSKEFVVFQNEYRRLSADDLEQMMQPRNTQLLSSGPRKDGIQNAGQLNYTKKFIADFSIEMTRSVRAMLDSWTES